MITPRFSCTQTAQSILVAIYCPAIRASEVEIHVDDTLFTLHINPYFLRLNFSGSLLEDDQSSAKYDAESGYLNVTLTKEVPGQEFKDLDLLAKLLAPRPSENAPKVPIIEVVGGDNTPGVDDELAESVQRLSLDRREILEAAENDWQLPQEVPEPLDTLHTSVSKRYGFLDMHSGYFTHVGHSENEVNELGPDAETCPLAERRNKRVKHEDSKWDEEHYMADYADDEYIQELIAWRHPYTTNFEYTEEEKLAMLRLPRKEYLASPLQTHNLYLTLLTLLFAYAYETRTTQGDPTPESAWTLSTLVPAFSALDPPPYAPIASSPPTVFTSASLGATLVPPYRRSLAFPLYRSFALAEACRSDVADILTGGQRMVVRCLLAMKKILDHHEVYYVYSKVWVDDFCVWAQTCASDQVLTQLGVSLRSSRVDKFALGWDLEALEAATRGVEDRDSDSDDESDSADDSPAPL
ncbi:hypothetical protein PLICRDRAFT_40686 [Plicaturopsis crispa FD-325 SS-3]|nr:hypothetical protein PLICRDRAFT_40686 [Plicaturopsis crispa FD-325 SS-3]